MMEWSDRHCRYLWRIISQNAWVYTEMVVTGAIIHGDKNRFLDFNEQEHPIALQLGGSDPSDLATCSKIAEQWGYDEVNLNCGCPSDRVQNNMIGAVLMKHTQIVADCLKAMQDATSIPVTIKHRIGVDDQDGFNSLVDFVGTLAETGVQTFIVHARKAWLQGLSPKENREVPPLDYPAVYRLKALFPQLEIILNGGLTTMNQCQEVLNSGVDGVMVGREAYSNPYVLTDVDQRFYQAGQTDHSRKAIFEQYLSYCETQLAKGVKLHHLSRHVLGLFAGQPGGRLFRRYLSENIHKPTATIDTLRQAYGLVENRQVANV
jgi:tRNA-dihydrouridine synthase A